MKMYNDHHDDEGYRAFMWSDEEDVLSEFSTWLDTNGIKWERKEGEDEEGDTIWTEWIKDRGKATLLKLTFGGV